ncbi:MAG: archaellin/type IV pilin N-terminal domain-containing protein [Candidatus Aenigmatarchaeota archaeon]
MKKAISPMVATVLLIGFTIAVGAILSVWFTSFTRTQTATVSGTAGCSGADVRVFSNVTTTNTNAVRVFISNLRSDINITVNSVVVSCGTSGPFSASGLPKTIGASLTDSIDIGSLSGCIIGNTKITVVGNCSTGGSFTSGCVEGTCGLY